MHICFDVDSPGLKFLLTLHPLLEPPVDGSVGCPIHPKQLPVDGLVGYLIHPNTQHRLLMGSESGTIYILLQRF